MDNTISWEIIAATRLTAIKTLEKQNNELTRELVSVSKDMLFLFTAIMPDRSRTQLEGIIKKYEAS